MFLKEVHHSFKMTPHVMLLGHAHLPRAAFSKGRRSLQPHFMAGEIVSVKFLFWMFLCAISWLIYVSKHLMSNLSYFLELSLFIYIVKIITFMNVLCRGHRDFILLFFPIVLVNTTLSECKRILCVCRLVCVCVIWCVCVCVCVIWCAFENSSGELFLTSLIKRKYVVLRRPDVLCRGQSITL